MNTKTIIQTFAVLFTLSIGIPRAFAAGDLPTDFSNQGSIGNTRHNMTQRQASGGPTGEVMAAYRNNYEEVCVYCHTPHGANADVTLPLWNRTLKATTYATYDLLGTSTLTQTVDPIPGPNSLACLSCHDGQTAVDSIINMPGSGRYRASQAVSQNDEFLNSWPNPIGPVTSAHMTLSSTGCLACHAPVAGFLGAGATDFTVFVIGTDLKNDHPVGITFPAINGPGTDFNTPTGSRGAAKFFDVDSDTNMDKGEVRVYDGKVECASCHDPHGVPTGGAGTAFRPTFLRVANTGSALCLTCHSK